MSVSLVVLGRRINTEPASPVATIGAAKPTISAISMTAGTWNFPDVERQKAHQEKQKPDPKPNRKAEIDTVRNDTLALLSLMPNVAAQPRCA
jgi:hypothetical protein